MSHQHDGHQHSPQNLKNINKAFYIGIFLNLLFTIIEFVVGYMYNSLALIADASHNLSDVASLVISLIGMKLAQKAATLTYTYGYKKASILATFINSVLLIFVVFTIFKEAIARFQSPPEVAGNIIIFTALIGVVINTVSAFLFYKGQKEDINIRGAFIHLLVDTVVSIGVVISGLLIYYLHYNSVDVIISLIIGIVILISTWKLFKESLKLTLDGIPKGIDIKEIESLIKSNEGVQDVFHIHIWAISSTINALSAHIVLAENYSLEKFMHIKNKLRHELAHKNIHHITLELDTNETEHNPIDCI
tara:strand:+ start:714870 stop:715784 length:915 start_codon:yes stop_codon:yes gene_type:complete